MIGEGQTDLTYSFYLAPGEAGVISEGQTDLTDTSYLTPQRGVVSEGHTDLTVTACDRPVSVDTISSLATVVIPVINTSFF